MTDKYPLNFAELFFLHHLFDSCPINSKMNSVKEGFIINWHDILSFILINISVRIHPRYRMLFQDHQSWRESQLNSAPYNSLDILFTDQADGQQD